MLKFLLSRPKRGVLSRNWQYPAARYRSQSVRCESVLESLDLYPELFLVDLVRKHDPTRVDPLVIRNLPFSVAFYRETEALQPKVFQPVMEATEVEKNGSEATSARSRIAISRRIRDIWQ